MCNYFFLIWGTWNIYIIVLCRHLLFKTYIFVKPLTSAKVIVVPSLCLQTKSSLQFFIVFLIKRSKCFWFIPEAAWTWVSTCEFTICDLCECVTCQWIFNVSKWFFNLHIDYFRIWKAISLWLYVVIDHG